MIQDAFSAGVEPGGLYSSQEIKILICYMLQGAGEPMSRQHIVDIIAGNGMANFFEVTAAADELVRQEHLTETAEGLSLTDTGRHIAGSLSSRIPFTLRERSLQAALQLLTRLRRERENRVVVEPLRHGRRVTCTIEGEDAPLMEVSLWVADEMQAGLVRDNFLNDPTLLYRSLLAVMTGDAHMKRADTQIVIDLK